MPLHIYVRKYKSSCKLRVVAAWDDFFGEGNEMCSDAGGCGCTICEYCNTPMPMHSAGTLILACFALALQIRIDLKGSSSWHHSCVKSTTGKTCSVAACDDFFGEGNEMCSDAGRCGCTICEYCSTPMPMHSTGILILACFALALQMRIDLLVTAHGIIRT